MLPIDFLPGARRDFDDSLDWYAERSKQASVRFAGAVDAAPSPIAAHPKRFAAVDDLHRECPVGQFPFRIVYRVGAECIVVVAVAHAKRRPKFWKDRI